MLGWRGVYEYREPIDTNKLSAKVLHIHPAVIYLMVAYSEWNILISEIARENIKVLEDDRNEILQFHKLKVNMEKTLEDFEAVVNREARSDWKHRKREI